MARPTDGGIHAFSGSVGLNVSLNDVDLQPIRGREYVAIVCGLCNTAVIGKVLSSGEVSWLNRYAPPHTEGYRTPRPAGAQRVPAPRIVQTTRISESMRPDREVWCEKHGARTVDLGELYSALKRAQAKGKVVRVVA